MASLETAFTRQVGIEVPLICGPMYPCSNPELVGAASAAGAIGVVQPLALTYVHRHDYREGLRLIRRLAGGRPIGMNALIEQSSKTYRKRMEEWVDISVEEGIRFYITSLGNPRWIVDRVAQAGGIVYHDATELKWARKGLDGGVHGLIAVNSVAGGHSGNRSPEQLMDELGGLGVPLVCAGGVGDAAGFRRMLDLGYAGVQMGTRFIATTECTAHPDYKAAILTARATDIVHTERLSGVPVAVINNDFVRRLGTRAGPVARWMLRNRKTKHWMRTIYALRSFRRLRKDAYASSSGRDEYWQAGKSVEAIREVLPAAEVVRMCRDAVGDGASARLGLNGATAAASE